MTAGAIQCFCCDLFLVVDTTSVMMETPEGRQLSRPKLAAPFICDTCRADPTKLKVARTEMFKFVGEPQKQGGFDE